MAVARCHTQLLTWRRELRKTAEAASVSLPIRTVPEPLFVPAVIEPEPEPVTAAQPSPKMKQMRPAGGGGAGD